MAHADGSFRAASAASPSVLEAALAYASRGWPVFPCGENKHPLTTNGYLDASVDPAVIARWWAAKPDAHVAVACGAAGIFVVDLDEDEAKGKRGGEVFRQFCDTRQHHAAVVARTPRGGRHLFFLQPLEDDAVGSHNDWLSGVDVKGVGGYVLLPSPASHGREWVEGDFWVMLCAIAWAAYALVLRRVPSALSEMGRLALINFSGVILLLPFAASEWLHPATPDWSWQALGLIVVAAIVPGIGAYLIYGWAQGVLGAARVSVSLYLGPLWNAVMAWLVLGEQLGAHHWMGALMILPGIYLATRKPA